MLDHCIFKACLVLSWTPKHGRPKINTHSEITCTHDVYWLVCVPKTRTSFLVSGWTCCVMKPAVKMSV